MLTQGKSLLPIAGTRLPVDVSGARRGREVRRVDRDRQREAVEDDTGLAGRGGPGRRDLLGAGQVSRVVDLGSEGAGESQREQEGGDGVHVEPLSAAR